MRRIVTIIISVIMVGAIVAPSCHASSSDEPENSFCIYGVPGMNFKIRALKGKVEAQSITYSFPDGSSHFDNPYVITNSKIVEWYNLGVTSIEINCTFVSAITFTSPDAIISGRGTTINISGDDGTPLSLTTKLFALKRMYLFPVGSQPNIAGVTPTPFVNDGSDIVVDDDELKNTIGAVSEFKPFMQFIFVSVIPWAGFAAVIILVFATIKFMLKG